MVTSNAGSNQTLVKMIVALIVCLLVMVFAGKTSVDMINVQLQLTKIKNTQEPPDETDHSLNAPIEVVGENPMIDYDGGNSQNVSYPSMKRDGAIDLLIKAALYGTNKVPPLTKEAKSLPSSQNWCMLEMLETKLVANASSRLCGGDIVVGKDAAVEDLGPQRRHQCTLDRPARQGNFTVLDDLYQFRTFPHVSDVLAEFEALTGADYEVYWADYPTGLFPKCSNWRDRGAQFSFHALYTLRRWFRISKWLDGNRNSGRGDVIVVNQRSLEFHEVHSNVFSNPPEPKMFPTLAININSIFSVSISPSARLPNHVWFLNISFDPTAKADFSKHDSNSASVIGTKAPTTLVFLEVPKNCALSLLRTLFVLQRPLFSRIKGPWIDTKASDAGVEGIDTSNDAGPIGDGLAASLSYPENNPNIRLPTTATTMDIVIHRWIPLNQSSVLPHPWAYTPCHKFDQQQLHEEAISNNNMDHFKLFWPFRCDKLRETHQACDQEERIASRRLGLKKVPLTTALALAGFVRSFAVSRFALWDNIVKPLQATPFAATWNVLGRTKKTDVITRKMVVSPERMQADVAALMMLPPHANSSEYIQTFNYFDYVWMMNEHKRHGFPHAGLYFLMSKVIQLVMAHETRFDIIIRSRFDVVPLVPMRIIRVWKEGQIPTTKAFKAKVQQSLNTGAALSTLIEDSVEYVVDFGASCEMQGVWWPQYSVIHEGKILKPPADTRYKFFGWQVCDWMEIGTYGTMGKLGGLMGWITDNYVFSAAQWVDHNYYVSQGIAYQPTQMFLKIMRKKGKYFG